MKTGTIVAAAATAATAVAALVATAPEVDEDDENGEGARLYDALRAEARARVEALLRR